MEFSHGITVTVERTGGEDRWGNSLPGTTHAIEECAPAPAGSSERTDTSATVEWDLDLLAPYDADLIAQDVVLLPGDTERYAVTGRPARFRSPFTGWEAGTLARLKGVQG